MISSIKDSILDIIAYVGKITSHVRALNYCSGSELEFCKWRCGNIRDCAALVLKECLHTCVTLDVSFEAAVDRKMTINCRKYDKHVSKVSTCISSFFLISFTFSFTLPSFCSQGSDTTCKKWTELCTMSRTHDLPELIKSIGSLPKPATDHIAEVDLDTMSICAYSFVKDRQWECNDTPTSLVLALAGKVGELTKLYHWTDYEHDGFISDSCRTDTIMKVADIAIYVLRVCRCYNVDLGDLQNRQI